MDLSKKLRIFNTRIWKFVFLIPSIDTQRKLYISTSEAPLRSPDYRLRPGLSLSSYGTNCALFSGIPQEIIVRAEKYTRLQSNGEDLVGIIRRESNEKEMKGLKIAEEIAKKFVAWEIDGCVNGRLRNELKSILD